MSKDTLKNLIKEQVERSVYEAECILQTSKKENFTDILTMIRAIAGVTIVNVLEAAKSVSEQKEVSTLRVKFIPVDYGLDGYTKLLVNKILSLQGVYGFHMRNIEGYDQRMQRKKHTQRIKSQMPSYFKR
tara:strand:- start:116 stop:505 length:390 start_codon:yes stop_codon:yes gene_type:complete